MASAILCLATLPLFGQPASSHCDPRLKPAGRDALAYQSRGNRCEGLYIQPVSGGILLASLTVGAARPGWTPPETTLRWRAPDGVPIHLRSMSLGRGPYYRMDANVTGRSQFAWPVDVREALKFAPADVGVFAEFAKSGAPDGVAYTAVEVDASDRPIIVATLLSVHDIVSLERTVYRLDASEKPGAPLAPRTRLSGQPASVPIAMDVPELSAPRSGAFYRLDVDITTREGLKGATSWWLYW